jgi:hypothetical protein
VAINIHLFINYLFIFYFKPVGTGFGSGNGLDENIADPDPLDLT